MHFTSVDHLGSVVRRGLVSDDHAGARGWLQIEVGDTAVKEHRRRRIVPVPPGGPVSSYVPFYFAPRSPMMFKIWKGGVSGYQGGLEPLVYLVSTIENLVGAGCAVVVTDGNAANGPTRFSSDPSEAAELVDWPLMNQRYWQDTPDDPDRVRRRMAECLVKDHVPFGAFLDVITMTEATAGLARSALGAAGVELQVTIRSDWYYP